jgi:GNAT superfamily N-acetyltransferase
VHAAVVGGELAAVAVWLPPGAAKLSARGAMRAVVALSSNALVIARSVPRIVAVMIGDARGGVALARKRRRAVVRASRGVSWRLDLPATVPEQRGRGIARVLLDRQLHRYDQDGAAVWLETTDPVNVPIYERFGFETTAHIEDPAWLPGLWVMRREPRAL